MPNLIYKYNHYIIYLITNILNNRKYVGFHATNNLNDDYLGSGELINKAVKHYGKDKFTKIILEHTNEKEWREKEVYWIKEKKTHISNGGYNLTTGGDGCVGYKYTEKQRQQLIIRVSGENNPMYGKKHTQESIEKNRKSNTGKKQSEETKKKRAKSNTGKKRNEKTIENMKSAWELRKINHPMTEETRKKIGINSKLHQTGKHHSEETKKKQSNSHKGKKHKRVICIYCGKDCTPSTLKRWHNDNCKFKV
jgi:NUMOD3 motif/GIY-YIG catalytic domain